MDNSNNNQNSGITRKKFLTICFFGAVGVVVNSATANVLTSAANRLSIQKSYNRGGYGIGVYQG